MSISGQGHSLTLVKGHSDFKVKCLNFGLYTQVSDSGPLGPLVFLQCSFWSALKAPDFSAFHWSARGSLVSIGQHFVITRVVQISKGRKQLNYRIGPRRSASVIKLVSDLTTESDQTMRAVHRCNSWFDITFGTPKLSETDKALKRLDC